MANPEVEKRITIFGTGIMTDSEVEHLFAIKRRKRWTWEDLRKALFLGNVPYFNKKESKLITTKSIYDAGAANGCPSTEMLLENLGPLKLMNLYYANNRAFRMIRRVLRPYPLLLNLWIGNQKRRSDETRIAVTQSGTPTLINENNIHIGAAKYECFALCRFFQRLMDAEQNIKGPIELPHGKKLYPPMEYFDYDAKGSTNLNEFSARIISRVLTHMLNEGVDEEQAVNLLLDCFLPAPILIEDNVWNRAEETSNYIADYLIKSSDRTLILIGDSFRDRIPQTIKAIREK